MTRCEHLVGHDVFDQLREPLLLSKLGRDGIVLPRASRTASGSDRSSGLSNRPGATVTTRTPRSAGSPTGTRDEERLVCEALTVIAGPS
jgi:hypothetical protein